MKKMTRYTSLPLPEVPYTPGKNTRRSIEEHIAPLTIKGISEISPQQNEVFQYGVDLFNAGLYWESHEAWEAVWHKEKDQAVKLLLQGLIQISAGFVKARQENQRGVLLAWGNALDKISLELARSLGLDLLALLQELQIVLFYKTAILDVTTFHHHIRIIIGDKL